MKRRFKGSVFRGSPLRVAFMNLLKKGIGVVGSTTIDKIVAENQSYIKLGGVTTYAGITYRRHGIPARIVSRFSNQMQIPNPDKPELNIDD